jgi:hypothetical protein
MYACIDSNDKLWAVAPTSKKAGDAARLLGAEGTLVLIPIEANSMMTGPQLRASINYRPTPSAAWWA